jgi:transcriptional regulator with XRE-family HTH domain
MKTPERGSARHDELRQLLLERRQRAKLTQKELAARLGWNQNVISKIEGGGKRVTVLELLELGEAMGFDPRAAVARLMKMPAAGYDDDDGSGGRPRRGRVSRA